MNHLKRFSKVRNNILMKNKIIDFVQKSSLFRYEGEENDAYLFSKRINGHEDVVFGEKLKKQILDNFSNINVKTKIVDEWVLLFVSDVKKADVK